MHVPFPWFLNLLFQMSGVTPCHSCAWYALTEKLVHESKSYSILWNNNPSAFINHMNKEHDEQQYQHKHTQILLVWESRHDQNKSCFFSALKFHDYILIVLYTLYIFTHNDDWRTDCLTVTRCNETVWVEGWCSWTAAPGTAACRRMGYAERKLGRKIYSSGTWRGKKTKTKL